MRNLFGVILLTFLCACGLTQETGKHKPVDTAAITAEIVREVGQLIIQKNKLSDQVERVRAGCRKTDSLLTKIKDQHLVMAQNIEAGEKQLQEKKQSEPGSTETKKLEKEIRQLKTKLEKNQAEVNRIESNHNLSLSDLARGEKMVVALEQQIQALQKLIASGNL